MFTKESNLKHSSEKPNFHLHIHYTQKGIHHVDLLPSQKELEWTFHSSQYCQDLEGIANDWLSDYCQYKNPSILLPFDWTDVSPFTKQVLQVVAEIPFGNISTYGQIAHLLNCPQSARAVGGACRRNPFILFIPCHRVLDAKQELRGYSAGGISVKKELLIFEKSKI